MRVALTTTKRETSPPWLGFAVVAGSLVAGLLGVGVVFLLSGVNPFFAIGRIFSGSFGSFYGFKETVAKAIPLIIIGAGLTVPLRGKFWNIGAESQLLVGAMLGTWFGLQLGPVLPGAINIPVMFLLGFIGGALWGIIPAILKIRFGINEVIATLMLNYVAAELLTSLIVGPWRGETQYGYPYTDDLPKSAVLGLLKGSRIHYVTLIFAVCIVVLLAFFIYRTKFGYEIRVSGESREAARYAGINFSRTTILMMVISGGLAGVAGVAEVAAVHHHLSYPAGISAGYGFTAIIVAWLSKLNPLAVPLSALFFAGILVGGDAIQISLGLPAATIHVFNGIMLFFLIAGEFFTENRLVIVRKEAA